MAQEQFTSGEDALLDAVQIFVREEVAGAEQRGADARAEIVAELGALVERGDRAEAELRTLRRAIHEPPKVDPEEIERAFRRALRAGMAAG